MSTLKEALTTTLVLLCVFGSLGYIILSSIVRKNPKAASWMKRLSEGMKDKKEKLIDEPKDYIQQVYDDRRTMM